MNAKKLLVATTPDSVRSLTALAVYLQSQGYEVGWYTGPSYQSLITKLGLAFYPFQRATEVPAAEVNQVWPQRKKLTRTLTRFRFDLTHRLLAPIPDFLTDLQAVHAQFPFDAVLCDMAFMAAPFLKSVFKVPVGVFGLGPLGVSSKDAPPYGLGWKPAQSLLGKSRQRLLEYWVRNYFFKPSTHLYNTLRKQYGLPASRDFCPDAVLREADVYLQSGVPGFEYQRRDLSSNVRFVGPLFPSRAAMPVSWPLRVCPKRYPRVVLVSQGMHASDPEKLLIPTLEAFKSDSSTLVIATTGGHQTQQLRQQFPQAHFLVEDYVDFQALMPQVHVFVTSAGYASTLAAVQHGVPIVATGLHEGKNEIAARVAYFRLGIRLKTETATAREIRKAVDQVVQERSYRRNVKRLAKECARYPVHELCHQHIQRFWNE